MSRAFLKWRTRDMEEWGGTFKKVYFSSKIAIAKPKLQNFFK